MKTGTRRIFCFLGIAIYACSFMIFNADMNLMETGLQLLISLLILHQSLRIYQKEDKKDKDFVLLSLLFVLACLTRIDMALFVAGYSLILLFQRQKWNLSKKRLAIIIIPPALASIAWITAGYLGTGYLLPTGGGAAFILSWPLFIANINKLASVFIHFFAGFPHSTTTHPFFDLFWNQWWNNHPLFKVSLLAIYVLILLSIVGHLLKRQSADRQRLKHFLIPLLPFGAGVLLMAKFYAACYERDYFFSRYFTIVVPLFLFFWLTVFALFIEPQDRGKDYNKKLGLVTLMVFSQLAIFAYAQYNIFKVLKSGRFELWEMLEWVRRSIPPEETLASGETGIFGYYLNNVINFDGKTNVDATIAIRNKTIAQYLVKAKPKYILDRNEDTYHNISRNLPLANDALFLKHYELMQKEPFIIWKRKGGD
jgi:hypothetical protein